MDGASCTALGRWGPSGHWQVPKTQWKACIEETSTEKAERYLERYRAVMEKDRQMCLGSYVFFWGQKQERTHTWYGMFLPGGERTGAVGVMQYVWTGQWPENRAPRVSRLRIEGGTAEESIHLKAGQEYAARIEASDPDADALAFEYEVLAEQTTFGYGGMGERRPATLDGLVRSQDGGEMRFVAPAKEGAYRLFVYVRDDKGAAATANAPFYVKP